MSQSFIAFPKDFLWGAATSSFQIEGSPLADGAAESNWYRWTRTPGRIEGGETADTACDHYHRYREDVALMKDLGLKTYRFSLSWPRIVPERGRVNEKAVDFYRRLIEELHQAGIVPNATLFHWEVPVWAKGEWQSRDTALAFQEYAEAVFKRLGKDVPYWATMNEPGVVAQIGYLMAFFPPGLADRGAFGRVVHHLNLGHALAVKSFRQMGLPGEIGWVLALAPFKTTRSRQEDKDHARNMGILHNDIFLDPSTGRGYPDFFYRYTGLKAADLQADLKLMGGAVDFLGVNHYNPAYCRHAPGLNIFDNENDAPEGIRVNDLGWVVEPQAFYDLLNFLKGYGHKKLLVTENGTPLRDSKRPREETLEDDVRVHYLGTYLEAAQRAIAEGVPLKGYYAWSLMDNFEWCFGYDPRFGIVHVDFKTQKRTLKKSARWYKKVIADNGFDPAQLPKDPPYRLHQPKTKS